MEARAQLLGFTPQKELIYNKLLPNANRLDEDSNIQLSEIKSNLGRSILLREIRPGCTYWVHRLSDYVCLYGRKFSKADHITFIKLMYELIMIPNLEFNLVQKYCQVLINLLKKRDLISPKELELPWRPLYELYESIAYSQFEAHGMILFPGRRQEFSKSITSLLQELGVPNRWTTNMARMEGKRYILNTIKSLIRVCQIYFPLSATQEMLDEWRPLLCPFSVSFMKGISYFELFLPTVIHPKDHYRGPDLWFEEFMDLWLMAHNNPSWETSMVWLFSRLAEDNIGYMNWEPYIPMIFSKILKSFNLPGGSRHLQAGKSGAAFEIVAAVNLITSMLGGDSKSQFYLAKLFKTLESYYHPSNSGKWSVKLNKLLYKLPVTLVKRLHKERYKKFTWEQPVPMSHRLSDEDITSFVKSIMPCVLLAMFSKTGSLHSASAVQNLATLRPELMIPPLLERLYPALETLTEPHRLIASMQCIVAVSRSMLQAKHFYPEGPSHVVPLLMCSLPGIDPNDFKKCMVTFQFIFAFVTLVPLVDCSSAVTCRPELTEQEQELCLATHEFEDFILQFMDKCFSLIENSTLEFTTKLDRETEKMNSEEGMLEVVMTSTFTALLMQSSADIYQAALRKLQCFVTGRILETKVAGKFAANMCRAAAKANAELALSTLLPHICKMVLTLTSMDDILKEEILDNELLYNLLLLSEIVRCDGLCLMPYREQLEQVLNRTLHLISKPGYLLAGAVLRHVLKALILTVPLEFRSVSNGFNRPVTEHLSIHDWGASGDLDNLNMQWHVPSVEEKNWARELLAIYLVPELEKLSKVADKQMTLTREEIQQSLSIILDIFLGAGGLCPLVEENPISIANTCVPLNYESHSLYTDKDGLTLPGNKCVRLEIGNVMRKLLMFLRSSSEDDTKSLFQIIQIFRNLFFYLGINKDDFEARWKSFHFAKKAMENKLLGKKKHIRSLLIDRIQMQHEMCVLESIRNTYTTFHQGIMEDLLQLSTSNYSEVRAKAQCVLSYSLRVFRFSYKQFVDKLIPLLQDDPKVTEEQFKGSLYIILSSKSNNFLTRSDWNVLHRLWPAIVQAQHSEKPSIIKLLDDVCEQVQKNMETIAINTQVTDSCLNLAKLLWNENNPVCHIPPLEESEIEKGLIRLKRINAENETLYKQLIDSLVNLIESGKLRWRHYRMALIFLLMLIRYDIPLPPNAVKIFVQNLIHDTLNERKIAIGAVAALLKQQKRPHKKIEIDPHAINPDATVDLTKVGKTVRDKKRPVPGDRPDNDWMQYHKEFIPVTKELWDKKVFFNKTHFGYYTWPLHLEAYAHASDQPPLDRTESEMTQEEATLFKFFSQKSNIDKWINFLSLEERKGKDRFDAKRFILFKGLFRNFGDLFFPHFQSHLERLVADQQESSQRCASEIIAGLIRGSKHWPFPMADKMQRFLKPVLKTALTKVSVETVSDWGTCIATASENGDPNRLHWLLELLMEDPMRSEEGSFAEASRLYVMQGGIAQQEWRVAELLNELLEYLKPYLTHPYQNVRIRLGSVLTNIFMMDIDLPKGQKTKCPRRQEFVEAVLPQLKILETELKETSSNCEKDGLVIKNGDISLPSNTSIIPQLKDYDNHSIDSVLEDADRKNAISLLKTVCKWLLGNVSRAMYTAPPEFFKFLPLLCLLENNDSDEELKQDCMFTLACVGHAFLTLENIQVAIDTVIQIIESNSWKARASSLAYLQVMVFNNMFSVMQNATWVSCIQNIVLKLLEDERVEVREMAGVTLGGYFHCEFIPFSEDLFMKFRGKCFKQLRETGKHSDPVSPEAVIQRHAGILGLCAYVNAHPYEVPERIPDILMILGDHLNDPQPIPLTVKKTLSNFRRTHHDSWRDHKLKFSDDQLAVLTDLLVSPSYYA